MKRKKEVIEEKEKVRRGSGEGNFAMKGKVRKRFKRKEGGTKRKRFITKEWKREGKKGEKA